MSAIELFAYFHLLGGVLPFFFSTSFVFPLECSQQNVHSKPIVNPRTHYEYPQEGGRLDAKKH